MIRCVQAACLSLLFALPSAEAQVPHVFGSWKLDTEASVYPGPMPQTQVRTYLPIDDESMVGLVVTVDARGNASFLQYAGKIGAAEYSEYDQNSLAQLQMTGKTSSLSYSETRIDEYTVAWTDKVDGEAYLSGTKRVSADGRILTIEFETRGRDGQSRQFSLVYEKQ